MRPRPSAGQFDKGLFLTVSYQYFSLLSIFASKIFGGSGLLAFSPRGFLFQLLEVG
jgi:hypothetical protein